MKSMTKFIIELKEPLKETFKTESGLELWANKDFSVDRLSNRIAKVVSAPLKHDSVIKEGYEVMFEPTILYKQIYQGWTQHYTALVDQKNMLFELAPSMIILYRATKNEEWKGYMGNCLLEPIKDEVPKSSFLILPDNHVSTYKKGKAIVKYSNTELDELGVLEGDEVLIGTEFINGANGVKFWIDGKEYWWVRNCDIMAIVEKVA
jgi:co-chaperonin GroES (HSP10)